jgi:branched-chain amino acid transport system substrate-binding protein
MRQRRWFLSVAVAVALGATAAIAPAQQGEPVKIGVIQPLSGPVAASGNYIRMGAEIARDWVNARGGVLGRQVQLVIEDNKSDPKEAASAAEKLIVRGATRGSSGSVRPARWKRSAWRSTCRRSASRRPTSWP